MPIKDRFNPDYDAGYKEGFAAGSEHARKFLETNMRPIIIAPTSPSIEAPRVDNNAKVLPKLQFCIYCGHEDYRNPEGFCGALEQDGCNDGDVSRCGCKCIFPEPKDNQ